MNKLLTKSRLFAVVLLGRIVWLQHRQAVHMKAGRDCYRLNNTVLCSEMKCMQFDSATMALDTKALHLTLDEYRLYRAEDAATINGSVYGSSISKRLHGMNLRCPDK